MPAPVALDGSEGGSTSDDEDEDSGEEDDHYYKQEYNNDYFQIWRECASRCSTVVYVVSTTYAFRYTLQ